MLIKKIYLIIKQNKSMETEDDKWIKKFFERFFDETIPVHELENCLIYKNEHMPDQLFQYTKSKHAKSLLIDNLMYLRNIEDLNDPFEGDLLVSLNDLNIRIIYDDDLELNKNEKEQIENQIKKDRKIQLEEGWEQYKRTFKIVCFSERNDINPMWAHYADNHKGICIEYNLKENNIFRDQCMPINYVEKTNNDTVINKIQEGSFVKNRFIWEVFSKKSKDWEYEKEWRLIYDKQVPENIATILTDEEDKKYVQFLKPKAVYLGLKISEEDKKLIIDMCNFNKIDIHQMLKNDSNYNLKYEKI